MLGWLRSSILKRSPEQRASEVSRIIATYGELLEKHPAAYKMKAGFQFPRSKCGAYSRKPGK